MNTSGYYLRAGVTEVLSHLLFPNKRVTKVASSGVPSYFLKLVASVATFYAFICLTF